MDGQRYILIRRGVKVFPRISVIIPTFGRSQYLLEALDSVDSQTYPAYEVIVVDDFSPSPVMISEGQRDNVKVLRHVRNQGPGAARNTGMAHSTGDWVVFLDDDDLFTPRRLELAVHGMGQSRAHAVAVEMFDEVASIRVPGKFAGDLRRSFLDGSDPDGHHPKMGQVVHRREDVLQFDPSLRRAQDTEWWLRMDDRAIFSWSDEVGLRVRVHEGLRQHKTDEIRFLATREIARRHGPRSTRRRRANLYRGVGRKAYLAGHRMRGAAWALHSFVVRPTLSSMKLLLLCLWPSRR